MTIPSRHAFPTQQVPDSAGGTTKNSANRFARLTTAVELHCLFDLGGGEGKVPARNAGTVQVLRGDTRADPELLRQLVECGSDLVGSNQLVDLGWTQLAMDLFSTFGLNEPMWHDFDQLLETFPLFREF
jgi:hypothetical protein